MAKKAAFLGSIVAPVILTAGLAGCSPSSSDSDSGSDADKQPGIGKSQAPTQKAEEPKAKHSDYPAGTDLAKKKLPLDPKSAVDAARDQGAEGKVYSIGAQYDRLNRTWAYDVQTKSKKQGFRSQIDGITGDPIESGPNSTETTKPVDPTEPLSYDDAVKMATDEADGKVVAWQLQEKGRTPAYQFNVEDDSGQVTTVSINVKNKKVSTHGG